jgi:hypothetical protein
MTIDNMRAQASEIASNMLAVKGLLFTTHVSIAGQGCLLAKHAHLLPPDACAAIGDLILVQLSLLYPHGTPEGDEMWNMVAVLNGIARSACEGGSNGSKPE